MRQKNRIRDYENDLICISKDAAFLDTNGNVKIQSISDLNDYINAARIGLYISKEGLIHLKRTVRNLKLEIERLYKETKNKLLKNYYKIILNSLTENLVDINQTILYEYSPIKLFPGRRPNIEFKEKAIKALILFDNSDPKEWYKMGEEERKIIYRNQNNNNERLFSLIETHNALFTEILFEVYLKEEGNAIFRKYKNEDKEENFNNICRELYPMVSEESEKRWFKIRKELKFKNY